MVKFHHLLHFLKGARQPLPLHRVIGLPQAGRYLLRMGKLSVNRSQFLLLAILQACFLNLLYLKAEEISFTDTAFAVHVKFLQPLHKDAVGLVFICNFLFDGLGTGLNIGVKNFQMF